MRAVLFAIVIWLVLVVQVVAQQANNPVISAARDIMTSEQKNLVDAVQQMPEDKYNFKPTPQQMTFGHFVEHVADANYLLCSKVSGMAAPQHAKVKESDGKNKLVGAVKDSFAFCSTALSQAKDSDLSSSVDLFGHTRTRAFALFELTGSWADHYGTAAMYLRLNGLLPPTAKQKE